MATLAPESVGDGTNHMEEKDELLELQHGESVDDMFSRLVGLVRLMCNKSDPSKGNKPEIPVVRQAGVIIEEIVRQSVQYYHEQEQEISDLTDELREKNIELNRLYTDLEEQETESDKSHHSGENDLEEAYSVYPAPLSLPAGNTGKYAEAVDNMAHDAFQYGQFETGLGSGQDIMITVPDFDDSEMSQQGRQSLESGIGLDDQGAMNSSETSLPQSSSPPHQPTESEESFPKQSFDHSFPSVRLDLDRHGTVYDIISPLRTENRLPPGASLERGDEVMEGDSINFSDLEFRYGSLHGDNIFNVRTANTVEQDRNPNSVTVDTRYGMAKNPSFHGYWPESSDQRLFGFKSKSPLQHKHAIPTISDELERSLHTLWRAGWDLALGQFIAWWHLLLFLVTTLYRMLLSAPGTSLPKVPVFTVPRHSWYIIVHHCMCIASFMSFLAWKRELDLLLLANGLTRDYMLDYIYEEDRWVLFIGVDKGMFRLGMFGMGSLWGIGQDSMKERVIEGLIQ